MKKLKIKNFIALTIAGIINSIGVFLFLSPLKLFDGGISGTSFFLDKITPSFLTMSIFLIVLNFPFFIIARKKIGNVFLIYSLYAILIYSLGTFVLSLIFKNLDSSPVVGNDKVLGAVFGGLLSGIGSGLVIRFGGALDGIEVMSVMLHKKVGLSVGQFVMVFNVILFSTCAIYFKDWTLPLYSIVAYFLNLKAVDFIVDGLDKGKSAFIITNKVKEIANEISDKLGRGVTLIDAQGYYSSSQKTIIYIVVNRFEVTKLQQLVLSVDNDAFISINEVSDMTGNRSYKTKNIIEKDNEIKNEITNEKK